MMYFFVNSYVRLYLIIDYFVFFMYDTSDQYCSTHLPDNNILHEGNKVHYHFLSGIIYPVIVL